jgi:outer membrane protein assembly factor BamB
MIERSKIVILYLSIILVTYNSIPVASGFQVASPRRKKTDEDRRNRRSREETVAEGGAVTASRLGMPFKRQWQYLTDNATTLSPTLDQDRIYIPLRDGSVICLERETGSLLWSTEPGGALEAPVAVGEKALYITSDRIRGEGTQTGGALRALDPATGLTLWVHDYERPFTSAIATAGDRLYAGSADGALYSLSLAGGDVLWKAATQNVVRGLALVTQGAIYFGSDDGALYSIAPASGKTNWKYQTQGAVVARPLLDGSAIYFGSWDGNVYALEASSGKLKWRSPTAAAVETSPVIAGDRLLIASLDDFVYALSKTSGNRLWKRRMDNRIAAAPIVDGDANMIAPLRGNHVAVFLNSDGRRVNVYQLERGYEIVAGPIFSDGLLFISTDKGLVVARAFKPPLPPDSKSLGKK